MKKRLASIVLSAALGLSLVPAALAEEPVVARSVRLPDREEIALIEESAPQGEPAQVMANSQPDYAGAVKALREGIGARNVSFSLADYHIPKNKLGDLSDYVAYRYGELFAWVGGGYTVTGDGFVKDYYPQYKEMTAGEYKDAMDFYGRELDAIVSQVPKGATDVEKVLFIHDYLAAHYEYDHREEPNFDAYTFFRDGKGVCQAYMLVFSALMDRLGIPVSYVDSYNLYHTWNVVQLDGKWYHVDVTWDDPSIGRAGEAGADVLGAVGHGYFLLSDEANDKLRQAWADDHKAELAERGVVYEKDFICGEDIIKGLGTVKCTDKTYETGIYADADSPVVYVAGDGSWYYVSTNSANPTQAGEKPGGFYRWRKGEESATRIGDYSASTSGGIAPLVEYEGSLFFASPEAICRYEPATGEMTTLYTQPDAATDPLSGIKIENGALAYKLRKTEEMKPCDVELLPWHDTQDGAFSYYYNFGAVGLKLPELRDNQVFIAWYDPDSGRMKRLEAAKADGTYGVSVEDKDLTCAIFVLKGDGTLAPVRDKFTVHPVSSTPAE